MKTQSVDTHPAAEAALIALLRTKSMAQKFAMLSALIQTTRELSRRALERANPGHSAQEIDLLFVEHHYGKQLADGLRAYLAGRDRDAQL